MIASKFYIFGVPDGFDMLDGAAQELSYFQRFYDGSTEDTKFTIHRELNGHVTYSYLKYNLTSGNSRTGSFFGMSLVFSGEYCVHPLKLYELFDYVYQNHVLYHSESDKGFLKEILNSDVKAKYLITHFEDNRDYIKFIERVLLHNLSTNDVLSVSFYPLDPSFKNENQNLVVKLPMEGTNDEDIINNLHNYSYVTISPDWKRGTDNPKPIVEISQQVVLQWKDIIPAYQRFIIQGLGDLGRIEKDEIKKYQSQTEGILNQLRSYSYNKKIVPTIEAEYIELCNQLADLNEKAGKGPTPPPPPPPPPPTTPLFWDNIKKWISDNKGKIAGIAGATVVAVVLLVLLRPKKYDDPHPRQILYCCVERVDSLIGEALSNNDFKKATEIADSISDNDFKERKLALINERRSQYHDNLGKEIDQLICDKKWKEAFDKTVGYFDEDAKRTKKAEIQTACLDGFMTKISEIYENNYSSKSPGLKQELLDVKSYIGDENYKALIKELDKKKPKEDPKPTNTYYVELWNDNTSTKLNHDPTKEEGKQTIHSSREIKFTREDYFEIRLIKNNSPINLKMSDLEGSLKDNNKIEIKNGWINVKRLQEAGNIKIKEASIDIQFKLLEQ